MTQSTHATQEVAEKKGKTLAHQGIFRTTRRTILQLFLTNTVNPSRTIRYVLVQKNETSKPSSFGAPHKQIGQAKNTGKSWSNYEHDFLLIIMRTN